MDMRPGLLTLVGLSMAVIGGVTTGVSYVTASPGGVIVAAWGLVVVGGLNLFRGIYRWSKVRRASRRWRSALAYSASSGDWSTSPADTSDCR